MYKKTTDQLSFSDFYLPFSGKLKANNRWIKLARLIPWDEIDDKYSKNFSQDGQGAPAKSARMALGALIIKERLGTSDEETIDHITENPYLQYFLGLPEYQSKAPFDPSMFVHFRKRFDSDILIKINDIMIQRAMKKTSSESKSDDDDDTPDEDNHGKLIIDATCVPSDIRFPTDLNLLNEAREKAERIIDVLYESVKAVLKKPRTYRQKARKDYLQLAKCRRISTSKRRKGIRKQLGYLRRDLSHIEGLIQFVPLTNLNFRQYYDLLVIHELYRQQQEMYDKKTKRIDDRIVSISQPYIRPIVRGKIKATTEFGAKISASVVNGLSYLDRLSWDAYNEAGDLEMQVENYKDRSGCYPVSIHADKIYRTRDNLKFCREKGIRLSGPPLGRPPKALSTDAELLKARKKQQYQDEVDRIEIEGKFGIAKRRYSLARIMTKLASTSETVIALTFLVMNSQKLMGIFLSFFQKLCFWEKKGRFLGYYNLGS